MRTSLQIPPYSMNDIPSLCASEPLRCYTVQDSISMPCNVVSNTTSALKRGGRVVEQKRKKVHSSPPRGSNSQPSDHTRHKSLTLYPIELGGLHQGHQSNTIRPHSVLAYHVTLLLPVLDTQATTWPIFLFLCKPDSLKFRHCNR